MESVTRCDVHRDSIVLKCICEMTEKEENTTQEQENSSNESQRNIVTVVLTADNHLGHDAFGQHKREERQQRLRDAFQQAVTIAIGQKADSLILQRRRNETVVSLPHVSRN